MKNPKVMKPSINGRFSPHGFARAASKRLIVLTLSFLALPCLLSAQTLLHRYSFVSDASDSIGGANGTLQPPTSGAAATISSGLILPGGAGSGYVSLPAGILSGTTNLTIECWTAQATQQNWAELLNFGVGGTATYLALIADNNANANHLSVGFRLNNTESDAVAGFPLPDNQEQYIAVTFNTNTLVGNLYTNGILVASTTVPNINYTPGFLGGAGGPTVNTLGVDPWND
ncbi:MAG: LamG-like jellyroll fold domain-containing protein, partial [Limisphaerales bacterium]